VRLRPHVDEFDFLKYSKESETERYESEIGVKLPIYGGNCRVSKWTPQIFQVKAEQRTGIYERPRYSIVNEDGRAVQTWKNGKKSFYSDELLLVSNRDEPQMTMAKALEFNGVKTNAHDLLY
jgi:hypothetical protein